jgi:ankyrin repeat protein
MLAFRKNKRQNQEKIVGIGTQLPVACERRPQNFNRIQDLVESCPEAVNFIDGNGRVPLHTACAKQAPLEVVQFLIQQFNDSVRQTTTKGLLPLHYACREQASLEVIQFLLQRYPDGIKQVTSTGWLPLHLAIARQATKEVIRLLVKQWKDSVRHTTQDGGLPLHFACASKAPVDIIQFLVQYNAGAVKLQDDNEWTPLHIACACSPSLEVIRYLVDQWRDGLKAKGKQSRIPLHVACWERRSLMVVEYLVQQWRKSMYQKDQDGLLPLHGACQGGAPLKVIQFLIQQYPESALEIGQTPKEMATYACSGRKPSMELVAWMQQVAPVQQHNPIHSASSFERSCISSMEFQRRPNGPQRIRTESQELKILPANSFQRSSVSRASSTESEVHQPQFSREVRNTGTEFSREIRIDEDPTWAAGEKLHRACEVPQSMEVIRAMLRSYPKSIEHKAYAGVLPIHTACLNQAPLQVIEFLCENYPQSLEQRDDGGSLPIHLACYSSAPFESIKLLVQQWPESLDEKNKRGLTPLDNARNPFYDNPSPELVSWMERQCLPATQASPQPVAHTAVLLAPHSALPRPGVVVVNEPSRPDCAMCRTAHEESAAERSVSNFSFTPPLEISELRSTLDAMKRIKKEKQRQSEFTGTDEERLDDEPSTPASTHPSLASAYVAACSPAATSTPIRPRSPAPRFSLPLRGGASPNNSPLPPRVGGSTDLPPRPRAVMTNEPAIRLDSAMCRAAYGEMPRRQSGGGADGAIPRRRSNGDEAFPQPAGVDEVRATLNAMRACKHRPDMNEERSTINGATLSPGRQDERAARQDRPAAGASGSSIIRNAPPSPLLSRSFGSSKLDTVNATSPPVTRQQHATSNLNTGGSDPFPTESPRPQMSELPLGLRDLTHPKAASESAHEHDCNVPTKASSFYRMALEESKMMEREAADSLNLAVPGTASPAAITSAPTVAMASAPTADSSFFKATAPAFAMIPEEGVCQYNEDAGRKLAAKSTPGQDSSTGLVRSLERDGHMIASSFYRAALEARGNEGVDHSFEASEFSSGHVHTENEGQKSASASGNYSSFYREALQASGPERPNSADGLRLDPMVNQLGPVVGSSFYRAALDHASSDPTPFQRIPQGNENNNRPVVQGSFYRAAIETAESDGPAVAQPNHQRLDSLPRPGAVMVNEPAIHPDSAMYRAAYGRNQNARTNHYGSR